MKKRYYSLDVEIKEDDGRRIKRYSGFRKIRYRYNKSEQTLKAVLTTDSGRKQTIDFINVIAVTKYEC